MELERGIEDESVAGRAAAADLAESDGPAPGGTGQHIDSETGTTLLRRCTALAARARVELLAPGPRTAAEELAGLLDAMEAWQSATLEDPDPTMTVLAAAALQDLAERLQDPASAELAASVETVLRVLRGLMERARVDVPA